MQGNVGVTVPSEVGYARVALVSHDQGKTTSRKGRERANGAEGAEGDEKRSRVAELRVPCVRRNERIKDGLTVNSRRRGWSGHMSAAC